MTLAQLKTLFVDVVKEISTQVRSTNAALETEFATRVNALIDNLKIQFKSPTAAAFATALDFSGGDLLLAEHTQAADVTFTLASASHVDGTVIMATIVGDSTNDLILPDGFLLEGAFDNTATNLVKFTYLPGDVVLAQVSVVAVVAN
jgi:hypothetical protein